MKDMMDSKIFLKIKIGMYLMLIIEPVKKKLL